MRSQIIEEDKTQEKDFTTTEVIKEQSKKKTFYYIPCFVRFKVKELISIDIDSLQGTISGTLLFSFYYGNLDRSIVDQFTGDGDKAILLEFSRQESIELREDRGVTFKEDEQAKIIDFVVRQDFNCFIVGNVFYTPFEIINYYLTITIQTVPLNPRNNNGKRIDIKFNCMSNKDAMLISYGDKCHHGLYSLAHHYIGAKYTQQDINPYHPISIFFPEPTDEEDIAVTNVDLESSGQLLKTKMQQIHAIDFAQTSEKPFNQQKDNSKLKYFQYAHFRMPFYKHPGVNLIEIFIPIWILGFINVLVFFQANDLAGKLAIIATIALAFIAFFPTINASVPNTPGIKMIDILIYLEVLTTFLSMIDSLITWNTLPGTYVFEYATNAWFIATVIINILCVIVVVVIYFIHKVSWERAYIADNPAKKEKSLFRKSWSNKQADETFRRAARKGHLTMI